MKVSYPDETLPQVDFMEPSTDGWDCPLWGG
jgi:hypothetical protein